MLRTKPSWLLVCLALAGGPAPTAAGPDTPPVVESWELGRGTTAVLVEDHRAPLISLRLVFPSGKWSPWFRQSHAEEAFEIQMHDPQGELRRRADRLSAELWLSTGNRTSVLYASCLAQDLPEVLRLVRDILSNRDFDRHELKRRRHGRRIGWKTSLKSPWFRGRQEAARALFDRTDPRRRVWEKPESVETRAAALAEARDGLIRLPGRLVAFAGAITRPQVERVAADLLPPVVEPPPPDLEPRFLPITPFEARERDVTVRIPRLTQVYFGLGRASLPETDPAYPAFVIANQVLGGHFYSRLYVALRHEGGETYGAFSTNLGDVIVGPYGLGTFTRTANAEATEKKLLEVLRVFHARGISEEERSDAVGWLLGQRPFRRQSPDQVLGRWLRDRSLGLPPGFGDELIDRAAQLDTGEINRFIADYFDPARFTMIRVATE